MQSDKKAGVKKSTEERKRTRAGKAQTAESQNSKKYPEQDYLKKSEKSLKEERRYKKRKARKQKLGGICFLCFFIALFLSHASYAGDKNARIIVKADNIKIKQDEEMPALKVEAKLESDRSKDKILDKESGYTVGDLLDDLNSGKYYKVSCKADTAKEGSYPIVLDLDEDLEKKELETWKGRVNLVAQDGTLSVENKIGTWSGNQFKKYDGSLVTSDFVSSKGKVYYFDKKGNKVTGVQEIDGKTYQFDKNGAMKTGFVKIKDSTYYYTEEGTMQVGWLTLKKSKYYFESSGKMLTGKQQVGLKKCVFGKDGKLKSEEYSIDTSKPMIALTFDDGPGERTMELLEALEKNDAHATFFMVGQNAAEFQDEIAKMTEIGCELGNHSWDHANLSKLDASGVKEEINSTNSMIKKADGSHTATVMRPPYGAISDTVESSVGMPMILWSIDTLDWKTMNTQSTINAVLNNVEDGDIILMHDIHSPTIDAALTLIPKLIEEGYQLVTVSELAEAKGVTLKNGSTYTDFCADDEADDSSADEDTDSTSATADAEE